MRHRHFLVLPAFLLLVGSGFVGLQEHRSAMASVTNVALQSDSGVFASEGLFSVSVGGYDIASYDGAIFVSKGATSVTVAALSAPAYIRDLRMIVPEGTQWTTGGDTVPAPIPAQFLAEKLLEASSDMHVEILLPEPRAELPPEESFVDFFLLTEHDDTEHVLGALRFAIESGDIGRTEELLSSPQAEAAIRSSSGEQVLAVLLSRIPSEQKVLRMSVLQRLLRHEDSLMLAAFHPAYRDMVFALLGSDTRDVPIELMPYAMLGTEPLSPFLLDALTKELSAGDAEFIEVIAAKYVPLVARLESRGYPKRAQDIAHLTEAIIDAAPVKTSFLRQARRTLWERENPSVEEDASVPVSAPAAPKEEPKLPAEQVERMAYAALEQAGALFSVHTTVTAVDGTHAHIRDVVFSTPTEDRTVSFTLNVSTQMVSGTQYPYDVSFDAFVEWVRR